MFTIVNYVNLLAALLSNSWLYSTIATGLAFVTRQVGDGDSEAEDRHNYKETHFPI